MGEARLVGVSQDGSDDFLARLSANESEKG
jgi:hypothetical protein